VLKCREVVDSADQLLDGTMTWQQRLKVKVHLLMCHHCRRYVRQLRSLLQAIPFMHGQASNEEVDKVIERINNDRVKNDQGGYS